MARFRLVWCRPREASLACHGAAASRSTPGAYSGCGRYWLLLMATSAQLLVWMARWSSRSPAERMVLPVTSRPVVLWAFTARLTDSTNSFFSIRMFRWTELLGMLLRGLMWMTGSRQRTKRLLRIVMSRTLGVTRDKWRRHRRDFFIAYDFTFPSLEAGNYTFELTIKDEKGKKFGHAAIGFRIR